MYLQSEYSMSDLSMTLPDGRSLGFRCLGDENGSPLFFFHGTPGSRFVLSEDDAMAQIPGVRLILPERPGYGISDPQPGRTLLDWPEDVAQLADHLGLDSFAVSGSRVVALTRSPAPTASPDV